jgi:hypothetical protein
MSFSIKARTLLALGASNVLRVAAYKLSLKSGLSRVQRLKASPPQGPFFVRTPLRPSLPAPSQAWRHEALYFDFRSFPLESAAPDWMLNPYTGKRLTGPDRPWWQIPDFDPAVGDIKVIWEPSRLSWVLAAAERAAAGSDEGWEQLETWLSDWCENNPPYRGPNWKCGQEASIRVMHLAMAAIILSNSENPTPGLICLIEIHLKRIEPTIQYAIGQDNNHGTSEAAALFIGGAMLDRAGLRDGRRYTNIGRRLIENRVNHLVAEDGSFSQHSMTYHRLFLDTMAMAEVWRLRFGLPTFSERTRQRLARASEWLFAMIDPQSGDAPNLGANDGARVLPLTDTGYRDFRPTVQIAMELFCGEQAYLGAGSWNEPFAWLGIVSRGRPARAPGAARFDKGGYAILRAEEARAIFRYPRFRFRPGQSDALHVDLWLGSLNSLRDAGTFSYGIDNQTLKEFAGAAGHNTISFDGRDQMPRLGRFLFGEWLRSEDVSFDARTNEAGAGYTDWCGNSHHRTVALGRRSLTVRDRVSGPFESAVLRWRLGGGNWHIEGNRASDGQRHVTISSDVALARTEIVERQESLFYLERQPVPVLECELTSPSTIITEFSWS